MKSLIKFVPYFIITSVIICVTIIFTNNIDTSVSSDSVTNSPLIIIDAGHGGVDGGAVAADGTQEQYINLDIAMYLNELLTQKGYKTIMTRTDNNSIHDKSATTIREKKVSDLRNRLKIAESDSDSIFVSIHQNYYTDNKYWGTQVFYSPNNEKSARLAQHIQSSVISELQPENTRKIKKSDDSIFLLYHITSPAVMVECGFLSNYEETVKLNDASYRKQMAESICNGIINYICDGELTSEPSEGVKNG